MPQHGDREVVTTTGSCIMRWSNFCKWPGGPGCHNATFEGPCCGEGDWYVEEHLLAEAIQKREVLPPNAQ